MFKDKTIIITGASSGLGKELGRRLIHQGAHLALFARNKDKLINTKDELRTVAQKNQKIEIFQCDVSDFNETEKAVESLIHIMGSPDMLINNAGIVSESYFENLSVSTFRKIFDVNYFGVVNCIKSVLPHFKKKGRGRIVNIASLGGKIASFGYSAYSSSKYAIVGLSDTLRMELKPQNISVNLVCPGEFESPMVDELNTYRTRENLVITQTVPVLSIDFVADEIIAGILKERYLIVPGKMAKLVELTSRWFPSGLRAVVDHKLRKVYQGPARTYK